MNPKTERLHSKNIFSRKASQYSVIEYNYTDKGKKELKETYSSFIIRLLEDSKNFKKQYKNRRKSNNIIINDSFKKNSKTKYLTTNNYNKKYKNNFISNNSKLFNKKSPIKSNLSYSYKTKKINNDSYTNPKVPMLQIGNINKTNYKAFKINSYKNKKINSIEKEDKNKNKVKNQRLNTKKNILSKLYGYNKKYIFSKSNILKNKNLLELDKYQNNILKISQQKLSRDNLIKLYTELQSIKKNADMVKPLPPINFPALVIHSFKEVDDREKHRKSISFENKKIKEMDEYEKELYDIKKSYAFKKSKYLNNKRLYKILEVLPAHVVEAFFKNKK